MNMPKLSARKVAKILFDEFHSESWTVCRKQAAEMQPDAPENSSYQAATDALSSREFVVSRNCERTIDPEMLKDKDVLALLHPCDFRIECTTSRNSPRLSDGEIEAVHEFVKNGGGLLVVTEYENQKYGNNLDELVSEFGITIDPYSTVSDRHCGINEEKTHILADIEESADDLLIGANKACFYRSGSCKVQKEARILVPAAATAKPKHAGLIAISEYGQGRVVVVNDSDLFGDEYIHNYDHLQLWLNLFYWMSEPAFSRQTPTIVSRDIKSANPNWLRLKQCINELRRYHRQKRQLDNSYKVETTQPDRINELVGEITGCVCALKEHFPHQEKYLNQIVEDFKGWQADDFEKPNFLKSLNAFNPQTCRREDIEHLVVFPLYTPNNSLDIYFEVLIIRIPWYHWLSELERAVFRNDKFVPGLLVDFTKGYDSECAVIFPETVSIDGPASNNFGIIFCDREAKRYQRCVQVCADIVSLNIPTDFSCFLTSLELVTDMFAAWDLVHDTSHSKGPLPFDPFMIRQLAPYWMYGLEELRVDLRSALAGLQMVASGFPFGKTIAYGVLFDRIFRFAITGSRSKNYDGLSGQLLFAALHKKKALIWEDNTLRVVWDTVFSAMETLSEELEKLYNEGANQSRVRRYVEGHKFISAYLMPAVNSEWSKPTSISIPEEDFKGWIVRALNDEFPLGSFHTLLKKKYESAVATQTR